MEIKKVSVIGLGALGIMFAHHMSKSMAKDDLRIVVDADRLARYNNTAFTCNGEVCDFNYVDSADDTLEKADLLIFGVKFGALPAAIEAARNHVGENTIILSLLNGVVSEEHIAEAFGPENVLLCVAQGMDAVKEGPVMTYKNMGLLSFGSRVPGEQKEQIDRVVRFFERVNMPYETPDDMVQRMWSKLIINVGINQTVTVFESDYSCVQSEGEPRSIMLSAMRETIQVGCAEGIALSEADIEYWKKVIDKLNPLGKPSMRQDAEAKRKTEVGLFAGTIKALGKKHGIPTPTNDWLYEKIMELESSF